MASLSPKTGVLGTRLAAHLLRRTCFNYTKKRVDDFATKTVAQAVSELMASPPPLQFDEPIDPKTGQPWVNTPEPSGVDVSSAFEKKYFHMGYWFNELIQDTTIHMKMAFFLHTNFSTSWLIAGTSENHYDHHILLRLFATGNFKTLTKKITLDNSMLLYLNNNVNTVTAPNENYARELLELFTIGKGPQIAPENYTNYTEDDVKAAARVLTGYVYRARETAYIDSETGLYAGSPVYARHDKTDKTFSDAFDNTVITGASSVSDMDRELDDFLDMIFDQAETARYICRKLYKYFVHAKINDEIENDIIEPLAATFRNNDYELAPVLEQLFKSKHFYNEDDYGMSNKIIGGMIKSPLEILAHTIKFFDVQLPDQQALAPTFYYTFSLYFLRLTFFDATGFMLNAPDTVESYPGYHEAAESDNNWFISSTIIPRYKVGQMFVTNRRVLTGGAVGAQMDTVAYIEDPLNVSAPDEDVVVVDEMIQYLFPEPPSQERFDYFLNDIFREGLAEPNWMFEWQRYEAYQDDSSVRIPLNALVIALLGTPEFQLM